MSRKTQALSYFSFTLTQGSADAFIQASIATALTGQTKTCYRIALLELEMPKIVTTDSSDWQFQLTRKSYAAMPTSPMLEKSNIFAYRKWVTTATAVGFQGYERIVRWTWSDDDAPIIVEDPIYASLDTASTTLSNVVYGRIGYWSDSISEVDKLTLVANSLS